MARESLDDAGTAQRAPGGAELAAAVERLGGDEALLRELRRDGFSGPSWQRVAEELARYGVAVFRPWIIKGTVFGKLAEKGRKVPRPPPGALDDVEAASLANEVVAEALAHFRTDVLMRDRWDPRKGASLTTFFIGQCLFRFPNLYRTWLAHLPAYRLYDSELDVVASREGSVEDDVIRDAMLADALRTVHSDDTRRGLVMNAMGYTHAEIGERLGKTPKAVERMLDYGRSQIRKGSQSA